MSSCPVQLEGSRSEEVARVEKLLPVCCCRGCTAGGAWGHHATRMAKQHLSVEGAYQPGDAFLSATLSWGCACTSRVLLAWRCFGGDAAGAPTRLRWGELAFGLSPTSAVLPFLSYLENQTRASADHPLSRVGGCGCRCRWRAGSQRSPAVPGDGDVSPAAAQGALPGGKGSAPIAAQDGIALHTPSRPGRRCFEAFSPTPGLLGFGFPSAS